MEMIKPHFLKGKKILIAASGSIAAIKTPSLVSRLVQKGAEVRCVVTTSAAKLVSPLSLSTLSRNQCYQDQDQWNPIQTKPLHIDLAEWAELIVVAPLSATTLSRWIHGSAEGLLASVLLASESPIIAAAAMNTGMWENTIVQKSWKELISNPQITGLSPSKGLLACDRIGEGKMANEEIIELAIESNFIFKNQKEVLKQDWNGLNVLVTAGPTVESLDYVRHISNRSSGRMGVLIAQAARFRGANVDLIHGPLSLSENLLEGLNTFPISSALEMSEKISSLQTSSNVIVMAAAIADIRKKTGQEKRKIKKQDLINFLKEGYEITPDLISEIVSRKNEGQIILGFAATTGSLNSIKGIGEEKRLLKGCDLLMANPIDKSGQGLEADFNGGFLLGPDGFVQEMPTTSKLQLAHQILDAIIDQKSNNFAKIRI